MSVHIGSIDSRANFDCFNNQDCQVSLKDAIREGNFPLVEALIAQIKDLNTKDENGKTPLYYATRQGNDAIARLLIENGANINNKITVSKVKDFSEDFQFPEKNLKQNVPDAGLNFRFMSFGPQPEQEELSLISFAIRKNDERMIRSLLTFGADVNGTNESGKTLLHQASEKGLTRIVLLLLEKEANMEKKDEDGVTAIQLATIHGKLDVLKVLLEHGANTDVTSVHGSTLLHEAIYSDFYEGLELLLKESSIDVNQADYTGWTPLHEAAADAKLETLQLLIDHGAEVNAIDYEKRTPLHAAAHYGNGDAAAALIINGANIHLKDIYGNTHFTLSSSYEKEAISPQELLKQDPQRWTISCGPEDDCSLLDNHASSYLM